MPASLDYLTPLVNLALGLFLQSPKVKPNDSRWIKSCKKSRTAFFFWFSENVEKPCLREQSATTVKKDGRMVVEQETFSFIVPAPEGPAGAGMCSQASLLRVWWLVNGQNKYLIVLAGTAGRWGGRSWARDSDVNSAPSWAMEFLCNLRWVVYSLDVQM